jgi:hypothetical protein
LRKRDRSTDRLGRVKGGMLGDPLVFITTICMGGQMKKRKLSEEKKSSDFNAAVKRLRPIQIAAGISFLLGKLMFIPAGASLFIEDRTFGYWVISIYASLIALSILLCLLDVYYFDRQRSNEKVAALSEALGISQEELTAKLTQGNIKL